MTLITEDKLAKNLELINQLLAKAESTPYPAEAQTFQEHAERLMIRHGIDKAQLDADAGRRGKTREPMIEQPFLVAPSQYRVVQYRGLLVVAAAFNTVEVLMSHKKRGAGGTMLYVVGAKSDVEKMVRLFDSLTRQVETAMTGWWMGNAAQFVLNAKEKTLEKRAFQLGFFMEVAARLRAIYGEESTGSELVLADRKARAQEHVSELYPNTRSQNLAPVAAGSRAAYTAGAEAGENAEVHAGNIAGTETEKELSNA